MGVFISNAITDRGRILLGEAQVGATFEATRIVMGSGFIPAGYTARTMTAVVAPVIELAINKKRRAGDGTVTFGGVFSNETITEAFYFREFALYARVEYADGTYSDEVLYSYGNAGDNADLMPAYSTSTVVEKQMDLVTWVGNDTAVNLSVASGLYIPMEEKGQPYGVAALDGGGGLDLVGGVKVDGGLGAFGADAQSVIVEHRKDGNRFGFVAYPDMPTAERYMVFDEVNGVIRQHNLYGTHNVHVHRDQTLFPSSVEIHPAKGADHGGYIDFHFEGSEEDFTARIIEEERGILGIKGAIAMSDSMGQSGRKSFFLQWYGHTHLRNYLDDNNFNEILLRPGEITPSVLQNTNGTTVEYQIYHTGNAPAVTATAELI